MTPNTSPKVVALFGHPNSGKTTVFNFLTGLRSKTVNYPGSTVDYKEGQWIAEPSVTIVDTPGTPSLLAHSDDERIALKAMFQLNELYPDTTQKSPDLVLVVLDGSRLKKQLVLLRQLKALGFNILPVLTMKDFMDRHYVDLDVRALGQELGLPIVFINARKKEDLNTLNQLIHNALTIAEPVDIQLDPRMLQQSLHEDYSWAEDVVCSITGDCEPKPRFDLDKWLLHPIFGGLFFAGIMTGLFWSIFSFATPFVDLIDGFFSGLIELTANSLPDNVITSFITDGLLTGFGSILVFVPQIFLLFVLMGLLEDSGYLARGALIVDSPLAKLGLNGKSFVPLLSGCACAIPAMMAARSIPGKKERFMTIFLIPLMSCSARLPVYGLLLALLLGYHQPLLSGLALSAIYLGSLVFAALVAVLMNRFMKQTSPGGFHLELPNYRAPVFSHIFSYALSKTKQFVWKAGPIIFMVSLFLWILTAFPTSEHSFAHILSQWMDPIFRPMGIDWRVGIALIFSFAAREVFVSALTIVFGATSESAGLLDALREATLMGTDDLLFNPASIVSLILFFMISLQCLTTVAIAKKELGGWRGPLLMTVAYVLLAYVISVAAYQLISHFLL